MLINVLSSNHTIWCPIYRVVVKNPTQKNPPGFSQESPLKKYNKTHSLFFL